MDLVKKPKKQNSNNGFASTLKSGLETAGNVIKYTTPAYYNVVKNPMMKLWKRELIDRPDYSFYDTFNLLKIAPKSIDDWVKKQLANYIMDNNLKYFANRLLLYKQGNKIRKMSGGWYLDLETGGVRHANHLSELPSGRSYNPLNHISGAWTLRRKDGSKVRVGRFYGRDNELYNLDTGNRITNLNVDWLIKKSHETKKPLIKTTTPRKPYFLSKYLNRANEIGVDKIKEWLKKIGTKVDGIWGENTERAYLAWLNRNGRGFKPGVYDDTELLATPTTPTTSTIPVTNADITEITGTTPTYSTTSTPQFNIIGDSGTTYSNEHVRDLFENVLLRTPTYKYATTFAKQGAKLVSKNPVLRFKRNFRKVAQ